MIPNSQIVISTLCYICCNLLLDGDSKQAGNAPGFGAEVQGIRLHFMLRDHLWITWDQIGPLDKSQGFRPAFFSAVGKNLGMYLPPIIPPQYTRKTP